MIEIDGSFGEGGGQILRTATALAAIKKIPCRIFNIRKKRPNPGLQTQHLLTLRALAQLCNGRLEGDYLNSTEIRFFPGEISSKDLHIRIETAGSIPLCLQSLLPVAIFAPAPFKIFFKGGGTDVPFSPTIDHFRFVFLKILEKMGPKIEINVSKRGFYPAGGGEVEVKIFPNKLQPLNLTERGEIKKISILSTAAQILKEKKVAERQISGAKEILGRLKIPIETKIEYKETESAGSAICIIAEFEKTLLGSDNLGKLGVPAEKVGRDCALQLLEEGKTQSCLDRFLTDQILIYLALSSKKCQIKIGKLTLHAKTNIWLIPQFLKGKFEIKENLLTWLPQ